MGRSILRVTARILGVVGIVGALVLTATSAHAAPGGSVTPTKCANPTPSPSPSPTPTPSASPSPTPSGSPSPSPTASPQPSQPDNCVPDDGSVLPEEITLRYTVAADQSTTPTYHITEVTADLKSDDPSNVPNPAAIKLNCPANAPDSDPQKPGCQTSNNSTRSGVYTFNWDTRVITPYNGSYTFRIVAQFDNGVSSSKFVPATAKHLIVDNPPQQPNAPRIVATTDKSVSVAWDANPEPDITSYTLERAITKDKKTPPKDSDFKLYYSSQGTSLRDTVKDPGVYWYRVEATRRSVNPARKDGTISSPWSGRSGPAVVTKGTANQPTKKVGGRVVAVPPPAAAVLTPPGLIPSVAAAPPPVPDAPYSAYLPYKSSGTSEDAGPPAPESGAQGADPRGAILPVAVGAFLVSSALALGRMPF